MAYKNRDLDVLLTVGTSTPWKLSEYSAIAFADPDLNVRADLLSDYAIHHNAVEDENTADANLAKKAADIAIASNPFRKGGSMHAEFLQMHADRDIRFKGGKSAAMFRTYSMVDDTTDAIPKIIWDAMLPELAKIVIPESLKTSPDFFEGDADEYVSVADIGPIMSATGQKEFWQLVRRTAAGLDAYKNGEPIKVYHQISCSVTRLSEPSAISADIFRAHTLLHVYAPNGLEGEVSSPSSIPVTEDYLCLPENPTQPISAVYENYLLTHSTRKKIYDQFRALVLANEATVPHKADVLLFRRAGAQASSARPRKKKMAALKIVQPSADTIDNRRLSRTKIGDLIVKNRSFVGLPFDHPAVLNAVAMEFHFGKTAKGQSVYESADALIFAPFDAGNPELCAYNYLKLKDAFVARSLDRRYHHTPLIVMNYEGCYDDAIRSHIAYANSGYNKEYVRPPIHDHLRAGERIVTTSNVEHTPFFFADIINGGSLDEQYAAAREALQFRLRDYHRVDMRKFGSTVHGTSKPEGIITAVVYASAVSEKLRDHKNGAYVGALLAELGMGICTGGGDQKLMFAPVAAYQDWHKAHPGHPSYVALVSTHDIVKVETKYGKLPQGDHSELHDTIAPRLRSLKNIGDFGISIGGGEGTGQETGYSSGKPLIYIGQDPSMHAEIVTNIGAAAFRELVQNPYALADRNIFLFPDAQAAEPAIRALHQKMATRPRPVMAMAPRILAAG